MPNEILNLISNKPIYPLISVTIHFSQTSSPDLSDLNKLQYKYLTHQAYTKRTTKPCNYISSKSLFSITFTDNRTCYDKPITKLLEDQRNQKWQKLNTTKTNKNKISTEFNFIKKKKKKKNPKTHTKSLSRFLSSSLQSCSQVQFQLQPLSIFIYLFILHMLHWCSLILFAYFICC